MKAIITGGAGFIGCNAASRYLRRGDEVIVIDNLARRGTRVNLDWLRPQGKLTVINADIADAAAMAQAFKEHADARVAIHLAGQVAVTNSVADPREDFNANALGTFNVLEAMRAACREMPLIYASTNKVYGGMEDVGIVERNGRYDYRDYPNGVSEARGLDFHSPYGCSKGAADQYVRDYARIYGMRTVVFRQSCIYGYRQFGLEDQGWIAWFIIALLTKRPISIYGDGKQVRDVLFIDDLLDAYDIAAAKIEKCAGQVFNIGGGRTNAISLLDLLDYLAKKIGKPIEYQKRPWRPGDQRCFISDNGKAERELGWSAKTDWTRGLGQLYEWVASNLNVFT
jgi:CDP-paratose 2-epimerase